MTNANREDNVTLQRNVLIFNGGLTEDEWSAWKDASPFYRNLSVEDEYKVKDFTGLNPLYLRVLDDYVDPQNMKDNILIHSSDSELMKKLMQEALHVAFLSFESGFGSSIISQIRLSSASFISDSRDRFINQMMNIIIDISALHVDETLYDHRYFYRDAKGLVKPVSGFVRRQMQKILEIDFREEYYRRITPLWVDLALTQMHQSCGAKLRIRAICLEADSSAPFS